MAHGDVKQVERRKYVLSLLVTVLVLVVETAILALNSKYVEFSSVEELMSSPQKLGVIVAYMLSVVLVPLMTTTAISLTVRLRELYRVYVVRSLRFETISMAVRCVKLMPILLALSLLLIVIGSIFKVYQLLLFSLAPFGIYIFSIVKPVYDVYSHSKSIDNELKWFLILLLVIEGVKANIKFLIDRLRYAPVLPAISRELLVIDRDVKLYGLSHTSALMARANVTPNNRLASIFSGYASRLRSGGDVVSWLKVKLSEELTYSEISLKIYTDRIATIFCQLMLVIYTVLPLTAIAIFTINIYFVIFTAVISTPLLVLLVYVAQPKSLNSMPLTSLSVLPILCMTIVSAFLYRLIGANSIIIGALAALAVTFKHRGTLKEVEVLDRDSIEILRMMIELRQRGFDVAKALEYVITSGTLHTITIEKLKLALAMLRQGIPLAYSSVKIRSHSFLFTFTLFTLGLIYECGSGDPEVFQMLYEYTSKTKAMRTSVEKIAKLFDAFAIINIVLAVWIWRSLLPLYETAGLFGVTPGSPVNMDTIRLLVYVSAIGYSLASNTMHKGFPILGFKAAIFLAVGMVSTVLL